MTVYQGEIWWAEIGKPRGAEPGFRRPVLVVQGDAINHSRISTVICVVLTSNTKWASAPGNVMLSSKASGLPKTSVVNVSQIVTLDKEQLVEQLGKLPRAKFQLVLAGIDVVLGR